MSRTSNSETAMHYWKTALLTLIIFGLGGIAGSLITARVIRTKIEAVKHTQAGPEAVAPEWIPQNLGAMERHVNLAGEQVSSIRETLTGAQKEILRARDEYRINSRKVLARADEAILALLKPEQREKFEEFKKKRRGMIQQRLQNGLFPRAGERLDQFRENRGAPSR